MSDNKTKPTAVSVSEFLTTVSEQRASDARVLIDIMQAISGKPPVMWGPSIIGFGSIHYKYESGREGDMPHLGFSPRKANMTIYFMEGFDAHAKSLEKLGTFKTSVSCLYITKLADIDTSVLTAMLQESYDSWSK